MNLSQTICLSTYYYFKGNISAARERSLSPSASRFSSSTSSVYRSSRYLVPYQHYAASTYYPMTSSTSSNYLLTSPLLRQRRRPWERPIYGYEDAPPSAYRYYGVSGELLSENGLIIAVMNKMMQSLTATKDHAIQHKLILSIFLSDRHRGQELISKI